MSIENYSKQNRSTPREGLGKFKDRSHSKRPDAADRFHLSSNGNHHKIGHKQLIRSDPLESETKSRNTKAIASPSAKLETPKINPGFPWKWDLPDIKSSPIQQQKLLKKVKETERARKIIDGSSPETDAQVRELNSHISWIYEETSESDTEEAGRENSNEKKGPFDVKFRDHLMKELLKQGKDMKWYMAGAKKALENLEKGQRNEPGLSSTARVSQELNQFLTTSMRPYYQEKKTEKRAKKKGQSSRKH